ncbi:cytochrome P450 [Streptomyces sp. RB6PN25]|uniref:Cytochrome P450 n=1 Tax=Streptomyces humicola TaxID=2953240 RepID=A0ABT1PSW1_9ACTN|nr:cytochrome P450 [Streptomyces humicola]MCQ4080754.1 cytochrome P450 [Streptomyces humicola]
MPPPDVSMQPFAPQHAALPYQAYRLLLDRGPVHRLPVADGLTTWVVCGHETARRLLADPRLSIDPASTTCEMREKLQALATEEKQSLAGRHLLSTDPPDHTRMRKITSRALTARKINALRPKVEEIACELLDALAGRTTADLLTEYALPLTVRVLCDLLGLPPAGVDVFHQLGWLVVRGDAEDDESFKGVIASLAAYFAEVRDHPEVLRADGLMRLLLQAHADQEITDGELNSLLFQLFFAGHESTSYFIANAIAALRQHPDQWNLLCGNLSLIDAAVEEMLRYEGSVKSATWRFATEPVEADGALIGPGEPLLIVFAAANRDTGHVSDPDHLDITRPPSAHLSFGHGAHHCLGHALGRLEAATALTTLISRYPTLQVDRAYEQLPWRSNIVMRGMSALPVRLAPEPAR